MKKIIVSILVIGLLLSAAPLSIGGEEAANGTMSDAGEPVQSSPCCDDYDDISNERLDAMMDGSDFLPCGEPEYVPGELIVKFKDEIENTPKIIDNHVSIGLESTDILNEKHCVKSVERLSKETSSFLSDVYKFIVSVDSDILSIAKDYERDSNVEFAEPNYIYKTCAFLQDSKRLNTLGLGGTIPNDPDFDFQWALDNTGQTGGTPDADIDAPEAWDIETGDDDVVIAVLDTGVDYTHPDLSNNIWTNDNEIPNNGIDDDGNGYIDDIKGWDFCNNDNDPMDDNGHGTHCAGIAGAVTDNGVGIAGVSWNCKIMALKFLDEGGSGFPTDAAEAIIYAADNGADVISMSFGGGHAAVFEEAIDIVYSQGVILIAAAGNFNSDNKFYPAAYDNTIAVAATNANDRKAGFSNYGDWVDIAAPGVDIYSTMPDDSYDEKSGTSMACPHVAGLAGLILSKDGNLDQDVVRDIITYSVDRIFPTYNIGRGRINAYEALLRGPGPATALIDSPSHGAEVQGVIDIYGSAWGEGFQYFTLEYGKGIRPGSGSWVELINSTTPVQDDVFVSLVTTNMDEGFYNVRLSVVCNNGIYKDTIWIMVNNYQSTVYVDDDNVDAPWYGTLEDPYQYIRDGIDDAPDGDTVYVYNGTYYDTIVIRKTINLTGEDKDTTIIDGGGGYYSNVVFISADEVNITEFTIQNGAYSGIYVYNTASGNTILGNTINNNVVYGIYIRSASGNTILGNTINNNLIGVFLKSDCKNNTITDNIISNIYTGIHLSYAHNTTIKGNNISNNRDGIYSDSYGEDSNHLITNNNITSNDCGICIDSSYGHTNNKIYHNNFIDNNQNAIDYSRFDYCWDDGYPSGGNYWSDYIGVDVFKGPDQDIPGKDGIGDRPYNIHGGSNLDRFPSKHPYGASLLNLDQNIQNNLQSSPSGQQPQGTQGQSMPSGIWYSR